VATRIVALSGEKMKRLPALFLFLSILLISCTNKPNHQVDASASVSDAGAVACDAGDCE